MAKQRMSMPPPPPAKSAPDLSALLPETAENGHASRRLWLIRHGPVPNPEGRYYPHEDVEPDLSDHDRLRFLAGILPPGAPIVTSGIRRAVLTAEAITAQGYTAIGIRHHEGLAEQNFGAWRGRRYADTLPASMGIEELAGLCPPGGESFAQLCRRVTRTVRELLGDCRNGHLVAVAHAGTIRAALAAALDLRPADALRFAVDPLSLSVIEYFPGENGGAWRIVHVNHQLPFRHKSP